MPNGRPCPRNKNSLESPFIGLPSHKSNAVPRATPNIPSVTMKAGIFALVTSCPLKKPAIPPAIMQAEIPKTQLSPIWFITTAPATPAKPITDPTDKSSPAELITNVEPIARIPITEVARRIFRKFEMLRKYGDNRDIVIMRSPKT